MALVAGYGSSSDEDLDERPTPETTRQSTFEGNLVAARNTETGKLKITVPNIEADSDSDEELAAKRQKFSNNKSTIEKSNSVGNRSGLFSLLPKPKGPSLVSTKVKLVHEKGSFLAPKPISSHKNCSPNDKPAKTSGSVANYGDDDDNDDDLEGDGLGSTNFFSLPAPVMNTAIAPTTAGPSRAPADYKDPNESEELKLIKKLDSGNKSFDPSNVEFVDLDLNKELDKNEFLKSLSTEQQQEYFSRAQAKKMAPGGLAKNKHQITWLAYQAKENELALKNQWALNRQAKKETQSKYAF